jgi:hypothetical protein
MTNQWLLLITVLKLLVKILPSQPIPSIFFYFGQGSSNLALLTSYPWLLYMYIYKNTHTHKIAFT